MTTERPPEATPDDEPTAAGFLSVLIPDDAVEDGYSVEFEDQVIRIGCTGAPAGVIEDMGATVEVRLHTPGIVAHLMLDAATAIKLGERIVDQARQAMNQE